MLGFREAVPGFCRVCGKRKGKRRNGCCLLPRHGRSLPPCSRPSRTSPSGGRQAAAILDGRWTRRRNRTAVGTEKWLRRGRTEKCAVRQVSCQLFVFKLNEGADGVSIAICAQKHRVQPSICLNRLIAPRCRLKHPRAGCGQGPPPRRTPPG